LPKHGHRLQRALPPAVESKIRFGRVILVVVQE
jgi:hypothetical protein